jgi:hypothetical protein
MVDEKISTWLPWKGIVNWNKPFLQVIYSIDRDRKAKKSKKISNKDECI